LNITLFQQNFGALSRTPALSTYCGEVDIHAIELISPRQSKRRLESNMATIFVENRPIPQGNRTPPTSSAHCKLRPPATITPHHTQGHHGI
jgi:hypothetical protein